MKEMDYAKYLLDILSLVLRNPAAATVVQTEDDMGILLTATVAKEDMGIIIGKEGQTKRALSLLLDIAGLRRGTKVSLRVTEPDGSPYRPFDRAGMGAKA